MKRTLPTVLLAAIVVLSGCSAGDSTSASTSPTSGASPASSDSDLAARYHGAGGDQDVYGLKYAKNRKGVPVVTVWTRKQSGYGAGFDDFAQTLASFLTKQGVSLAQGYVLDVYGPDGTRLHHYDTTPEENS